MRRQSITATFENPRFDLKSLACCECGQPAFGWIPEPDAPRPMCRDCTMAANRKWAEDQCADMPFREPKHGWGPNDDS